MSLPQITLKQNQSCYTRFSVRVQYHKCMKSVKQIKFMGLAKKSAVSKAFYVRNSLQG